MCIKQKELESQMFQNDVRLVMTSDYKLTSSQVHIINRVKVMTLSDHEHF